MAKSGRPLKVDPTVDNLWLDIKENNNDKVIDILKEKGVDVFDGDRRTALINSSMYDNVELLKWCIHNGADINFKDKGGMSAIHFAAQEGFVQIAEILIGSGADINLKDSHGNSPVMHALINWNGGKNEEMINFLIKSGADINQKNNYGVCAKESMGK